MKIFVTGVCGQLGHDVMNELNGRGYEGIGSDIAPEYSGAISVPIPSYPRLLNSFITSWPSWPQTPVTNTFMLFS